MPDVESLSQSDIQQDKSSLKSEDVQNVEQLSSCKHQEGCVFRSIRDASGNIRMIKFCPNCGQTFEADVIIR